jgi:uncharacterized protein YrrD
MMQFKQDATVQTADGQNLGRIAYVVIDPATSEVTHFVVREGLIFTDERVVDVDLVASSTEDEVTLNRTAEQLDDLIPFEEEQFVRLPEDESRVRYPAATYPPYAPPMYDYGYPPYVTGHVDAVNREYGYRLLTRTKRNIPEDTVALKEGARVYSADDEHVGEIAEVIANPTTDRATHFLLSQGLLLKSHKLVPVQWVRLMAEDEVYLSVGTAVLEGLPDFEAAQ